MKLREAEVYRSQGGTQQQAAKQVGVRSSTSIDGGFTIAGTVANATPTSFEFTLSGDKKLAFKKAVAPGK